MIIIKYHLLIAVKRIETGEVSTEDCVMCPQVMPECSQGTCAQGSQCMVVPQSCRQCARTECVPVNSADIGASSTCVPCNKMIPQCRCKAHQKCVIHPMTCEKCSWAECVWLIMMLIFNKTTRLLYYKLSFASKMSELIVKALMVVGPTTGYIPQYLTMERTQSSKGFSKWVSGILLWSSILRVFFWYP
jgi:hypothetical protein